MSQHISDEAARILANAGKPKFHDHLGRKGRHAVGAAARKAGQTPGGSDNIRLKGHKPGSGGRRLN